MPVLRDHLSIWVISWAVINLYDPIARFDMAHIAVGNGGHGDRAGTIHLKHKVLRHEIIAVRRRNRSATVVAQHSLALAVHRRVDATALVPPRWVMPLKI